MSPSPTVALRRGGAPGFPNRCIVCGRARPEKHTRVIARDAWGGATTVYAVQAPCCAACAARFHAARLGSLVRGFAIVLAAVLIGVVYILPRLSYWLTALVVLAMCCLGFFIAALWDGLRPPVLRIEPGKDAVGFTFRDPVYAREFASLNGAIAAAPVTGGNGTKSHEPILRD